MFFLIISIICRINIFLTYVKLNFVFLSILDKGEITEGSYISLSIDAGSNETYNKIHNVKGSANIYDKVLKNVKNLGMCREKNKFDLSAAYLVNIHSGNSYDYEKFINDFIDAGCNLLRRSAGKIGCLTWQGSLSKSGRGRKNWQFSVLHCPLTIKIANGQQVLFPRAVNSKKSIQNILGNQIQSIDLIIYNNAISTKITKREEDFLVFTSPMNAQAYFKKFQLDHFQKVIAIGQTTSKALIELGINDFTISAKPSEKGLAEAVLLIDNEQLIINNEKLR